MDHKGVVGEGNGGRTEATANKQPLSHFGKVSVGNVQAGLPAGLVNRSFDTLEEAWLHGVNLLS
jgi:hypothetical protein